MKKITKETKKTVEETINGEREGAIVTIILMIFIVVVLTLLKVGVQFIVEEIVKINW